MQSVSSSVVPDDLLLFGDALGRLESIPVDGGQLKLEILGRPIHLGLQLAEHPVRVAVEKVHQLLDGGAIFLAALLADAGTAAHLDVVVETGAGIVAGDGAVAVQVGKDTAQRIERSIAVGGAGVGAEVARPVLLHPAHDLDTREILLPVDLDVGKLAVVLEPDVVVRPVALDQLVLEDQRFQLGLGHPPGDVLDLGHQRLGFGVLLGRGMEIAAHPVLEHDGLAHIDDLALPIAHEVAARLVRQIR